MYIPIDTMSLAVRYVHLYLLTQSDNRNQIPITIDKLAEVVGIHRNTAYNILTKLKKTGHIEVVFAEGRLGNTYKILTDSEAYEKSNKRLKRGYTYEY